MRMYSPKSNAPSNQGRLRLPKAKLRASVRLSRGTYFGWNVLKAV